MGGNPKNVRFALVENPEPRHRCTRVFIKATDQVNEFYNNLNQRFLQFSDIPQSEQIQGILHKPEKSKCRVYRKGVFIRELRTLSHFDYNFSDDVGIDEARNMNEWSALRSICGLVSKMHDSALAQNILLRMAKETDKTVESEISTMSHMRYAVDKEFWADTASKAFGNHIICTSDDGLMATVAQGKGYSVKVIHAAGWYDVLHECGARTITSGIVENINSKGYETLPPTPTTLGTLAEVWAWLQSVNMTEDRPMPKCECFRKLTTSETTVCGYWNEKADDIHINVDFEGCKKTMLEELTHYITKALDNSRDVQQFGFDLAVRMYEEHRT